MIEREVTVKLEKGLEARPTALLVQMACGFDSQICISYDGKKVNVKSIMGMLSLGIGSNKTVVLQTEGPDEEKAADEIEKYLSGKED